MKILITNDDGIFAPGIELLARHAVKFGEVTVVAPASQCSAMSHRITIDRALHVLPYDFPVEGVTAYSVDGTPADCIRAAMDYILPEKPDIVLSGMNFGYNIGLDIAYSGTVGAAVEALMHGVPAMAFSRCLAGTNDIAEAYLSALIEELLHKEIGTRELWNVNFPGCALEELQGIKYGCSVAANAGFYNGSLVLDESRTDGIWLIPMDFEREVECSDSSTDLHAALNHYISVVKYRPGIY